MTAPPNKPPEKKRARRIASDEAHAWARNLRLKNPYAKMILMDLSHHVDGEGFCFVSMAAVADDCELALETIRKRLTWLEEIGAIAQFPQWIDENGRRNGEGRGKRTTNKIRLMLDASDDAIEAAARGDVSEPDDEAEVSPPSDNADRGLNPAAESAPDSASPGLAPQVGLQQPPNCVGGLSSNLNPEPEPEDSPPSVPRPADGEGGEDSDGGIEGEPSGDDLAGWTEFKREFEADGDTIVKSSLPMTLFRALNPEQRALLTKAARGLIFQRRQLARNPKHAVRPKPAPQTFIRETDSWEAWALQAPPRAQDFHIIGVECREADAYRNLHRTARSTMPLESNNRYSLKRPLTPSEMVFADMPNQRAWGFISDDRQIAAWIGFLSGALITGARRPLVEAHIIAGDAKRGFFAPWPWPPTKDGEVIPWPTDPPKESSAA